MADLKNILIVEDDSDMRRLVDLCLQADGHETVFAGDGVSAIGVARTSHPDLIVLDIGLPAGDGFAVMDRLNALPKLNRVPVIVVTGRNEAGDEAAALAAGAKAFLRKPFDRDEFAAVVREVLAGPEDTEDPIPVFLHDLRTPLAVIEGFANRIIDDEDETPEEIAESIEVIHRNAKKLAELVERFSNSYRSDDLRGTAALDNSALGG